MNRSPKSSLFVCLFLSLCLSSLSHAAGMSGGGTQSSASDWSSPHAEHVFGLPGAEAKEKGTLLITTTDIVFAGEKNHSAIPLQSIAAVSAGDERVELWGWKGRILRAAIPDGGGLVAATVMHHRVGMLTVEFNDAHGGYHCAVFYLPGEEADRMVQTFRALPANRPETASIECEEHRIAIRTVRVSAPVSNEVEAPAAYRALVYERLVDELSKSKRIDHVYREGEPGGNEGCPQYTMQLTFTGFKQGSQVGRASMGPVGMFVGTTQMAVEMKITDAEGEVKSDDQIKATVRGESESISVAGSVAKKLTKQFADFQNNVSKEASGESTALLNSR